MKGIKKGKPLLVEELTFLLLIMNNYKQKNFNTWLYIRFYEEDITEEFGNMLPYPHKHFVNYQTSFKNPTIKVFTYCWLIDGTFNTSNNYQFLNDIIARMMISFPNSKVEKVKEYIIDEEKTKKQNSISLKYFQNLKSIQAKIYNYEKINKVQCEDQVFWALKLYFELMLKTNNISYEHFYDFAHSNFIDRAKDRSTLKAKCKSIYNYYLDRDFKIFCEYERKLNDKEYLMTRQQNIKKINNNKKANTDRLISNCINGMFSQEYKKPNGKWNIAKISKDTNLHRNTISTYLKSLENKKD